MSNAASEMETSSESTALATTPETAPELSAAPTAEDAAPASAPRRRGSAVGLAARLALLATAVGLVVAVFVFAARSGIENAGDGLLDGLAIQSGLDVTNPRYNGEMSDGSPFSVAAARAQPDAPDPKRVTLTEVEGDLALSDGRTLNAKAAEGLLKPKDQSLRLSGGVVASTSDGYTLSADAIHFDLDKRTGRTESAVRIEGPLGEVTADRMDAEMAPGLVARFNGDVKVVIRRLVEPEAP